MCHEQMKSFPSHRKALSVTGTRFAGEDTANIYLIPMTGTGRDPKTRQAHSGRWLGAPLPPLPHPPRAESCPSLGGAPRLCPSAHTKRGGSHCPGHTATQLLRGEQNAILAGAARSCCQFPQSLPSLSIFRITAHRRSQILLAAFPFWSN